MWIFRKEVHDGISAQTHTAESDITASGTVWGSTLTLHKASSFAVQCVSPVEPGGQEQMCTDSPGEGVRGVQSAMRSKNKELTSFGARRAPDVLFLTWERSGPVERRDSKLQRVRKASSD